MIRLQLESATDKLPLDSLLTESEGVHATTGATGFGLPPVSLQWLEGAGDGAVYRGRRVLPRDIDLPLYLSALSRGALKEFQRRLNLILSGPATLRAFEPDGTSWFLTVVRAGGGGYIYGTDTDGERELATVLTLRAGDPFWTSTEGAQHVIRRTGSARGLLPALGRMRVSAASVFGSITMENPGDAPAYPVWRVTGPGRDFKAVSPTGETLHWTGSLTASEMLTVDTKTGRVTDQSGANRYADLAPAPRMWSIPPGGSVATVTMEDASGGTIQQGPAIRRNECRNPFAIEVSTSTANGFANYAAGTGEVGTTTFVKDATDGPVLSNGERIKSYGRRTITTAKTGDSTGWTATPGLYRSGAEGDAGDVRRAGVWLRYTSPDGSPLQGRMRAATYTSAGSPVNSADAPLATLESGQWTFVEAAVTATGTFESVAWWFYQFSDQVPIAGSTLDATGAIVGNGEPFAGSSPPTASRLYAWTGAVNASASVEYEALRVGASEISCTWQPRAWTVI